MDAVSCIKIISQLKKKNKTKGKNKNTKTNPK